MENEFQSGENNSLKKHIGLIALLLVLLIIGIVFTSYYTTFLTFDDSTELVNDPAAMEAQVAADYEAYVDAFWGENDIEQARNLLQAMVTSFETDDAYAEASVSLGHTEAHLKQNLALTTLDTDPEAALLLYADVYRDASHSVTERADALFAAMLYAAEEFPAAAFVPASEGESTPEEPATTTEAQSSTTDEISTTTPEEPISPDIAEVAPSKDWVFGEASFGPILDTIESHSYDEIDSLYKLRHAALLGMRKAADMTGSYRIRGYMLSQEYRLKAQRELENIHAAITGVRGQAATQSEVQAYLADNPAVAAEFDTILADTRRHYSRYMMSLVNNTELFVYYNPEIIYGLNNVLWTYGTLGYLGYDVLTDLTETYVTGVNHLERYASHDETIMTTRWARDYDIQKGVLGLAAACAHVQQLPTLEEEKIAEYTEPALSMSETGKAMLSSYVYAEEATDSCHNPFLYMGTLHQPLQDTLVNEMEGWTSAQFTLTQ